MLLPDFPDVSTARLNYRLEEERGEIVFVPVVLAQFRP
jgi:hypothetical protein